jgi:D-mannonate dehydratase
VTEFDEEALARATTRLSGQVEVGKVTSREELWANLHHFLSKVLPVAEENGVELAMHPGASLPLRGCLYTARVCRVT